MADADDCVGIDPTLTGPWFFGLSLDVLLFGILTVQTYVYYLAFPKDRRSLKLVVNWVYLVGMTQTILAMRDLSNAYHNDYQDCMPGRSNVSYFWLTVIVFSMAVALAAQWLYAYRIYIISHKLWIVILVICLSLGQLGTSIVGCLCLRGDIFAVVTYASRLPSEPCAAGFGWVWGPLNFSCDATITVSLSILLLKRRKQTLKKTTHTHITRVIRLVVETGLATSIIVVLYAVMYNIAAVDSRLRTAWFIPGLAMGKVYSNSMLALLNSRLIIVGGRNTADPFGISEIRSEVLRTEVGEDQITNTVARHRILNGESSGSV